MGYNITIGRAVRDKEYGFWDVEEERAPSSAPQIVRENWPTNNSMPSYTQWFIAVSLAGLNGWWHELQTNRRIRAVDVTIAEAGLELLLCTQLEGPARKTDAHWSSCRDQRYGDDVQDDPSFEHIDAAVHRISWLAYWLRRARTKYGRNAYMNPGG